MWQHIVCAKHQIRHDLGTMLFMRKQMQFHQTLHLRIVAEKTHFVLYLSFAATNIIKSLHEKEKWKTVSSKQSSVIRTSSQNIYFMVTSFIRLRWKLNKLSVCAFMTECIKRSFIITHNLRWRNLLQFPFQLQPSKTNDAQVIMYIQLNPKIYINKKPHLNLP